MRLLVPLVLLSACDRLEAAGEAMTEATSPVVVQGMLLGLDAPEGVDLSDSGELAFTSLCEVFLAYVADPTELAESPAEGAGIRFKSPVNGSLLFGEAGDGKYALDSDDGLVYSPGDDAIITVTLEGEQGRLAVTAPEAPDLDLPTQIVRESTLEVQLEREYDGVVAAVYDLDRGRVTWENLPSGVDEVYEFTHADEGTDRIHIPPDAFSRQGTYVVGVAGMEVADPGSFEGVNTQLSAFTTGRLAVRLLVVTES